MGQQANVAVAALVVGEAELPQISVPTLIEQANVAATAQHTTGGPQRPGKRKSGSNVAQGGKQARKACPHGRQRSRCKECGGSGICEHNRVRCFCKECGGSSICEHGKRRSMCKSCGGGGICEHGRVRSQCKTCKKDTITAAITQPDATPPDAAPLAITASQENTESATIVSVEALASVSIAEAAGNREGPGDSSSAAPTASSTSAVPTSATALTDVAAVGAV